LTKNPKIHPRFGQKTCAEKFTFHLFHEKFIFFAEIPICRRSLLVILPEDDANDPLANFLGLPEPFHVQYVFILEAPCFAEYAVNGGVLQPEV
jgi:hypothetical protein